jgi:DNA-binding CsgD family transcriptional regulator/SAM-dependent methyltransferase
VTDPLREATALFERHLDQARSTGPRVTTARMLLQLFALRFLSTAPTPGESQDSWQRMTELVSADPTRVRASLDQLAIRVESQHLQLKGIFTNHLLPTLLDAESLLREWVDSLSRIGSLFGPEGVSFGKWFDAVMDSSVTRGASALQSTTPRNVADLMVRLAEGAPDESFHDPCVGLGTILAAVGERARGEIEKVALSGQDIDPSSAALARLRLFLLGARTVRIEVGDVLREPLFVEQTSMPSLFAGQPPMRVNSDDLESFDIVLCDPPYGQRLANVEFARHDRYKRFQYGKPGKGSSDLAFLQHCIACLKPRGRAIVLIAHGPLFRGGGDGEIRKKLIDHDFVDTVIGLPFGTLPGLSTELALIVFRRGKKATRKNRILFIDASAERNAVRNLTEWGELADHIVRTSSAGRDVQTFSRSVPVEEIRSNGYSLQPRRYVAREREPATSFDIQVALAQASAHEAEAANHAAEMTEVLRELDVTAPWGPPSALHERLSTLTHRERQVFDAIIRGRLNKQIAAELGTVEKTVKVHRARIMQKMRANSIVQLFLMAQSAGIHLAAEGPVEGGE